MIELLEKRIKELQEKIKVPKQTQNYYNCIGARIFECKDLLKEVEKLNIDDVSGSFKGEEMEGFAAKCMLLGHGGKTTKELLKAWCDNDR